jgi:hypothetical protein
MLAIVLATAALALTVVATVAVQRDGGDREQDARGGAPLVTVQLRGGLCVRSPLCGTDFRITDTTVRGEGLRSRPLRAAERRALVSAIAKLERDSFRAHAFRGICPNDGQSTVYRFRGLDLELASCGDELSSVQAVRVTRRILSTLRRQA